MRFLPLKLLTALVFALTLFATLTFARSAAAYPTGITSDAWHPPPATKNPALGCSQSNGCHTGGGDELPSVTLAPAPGSGGNPVQLASTWFVDAGTIVTFRFTNSTTKGNEQHKGFNVSDTGTNYGTLDALPGATDVQQLDGYLGRKEVTHLNPAKTGGAVSWDFRWTSPAACTTATLTGWGNAVKPGDFTFNGANTQSITIKTRCNPGAACGNPTVCASNQCVDGVCCNRACGAECETCIGAPVGTCTFRTGGAPRSGSCGGTGVCAGACGGVATCVFPTVQCTPPKCDPTTEAATPAVFCSGGSCPATPAPTACAPYTCNASGTTCGSGCSTDADCTAGNYCATGAICKAKNPDGTACGAANECTSNFCVDGVCCNNACSGQCSTCNGATKGTCSAVTGAPVGGRPACATDGSSCGGACNGTGLAACAYPTTECRAASCTGGVTTLAANCDGAGSCPIAKTTVCTPFACTATGCATTCASDLECASGYYCSGSACLPKSTVGNGCLTAKECTTGECVDGVCCDRACTGQCEACDVGGKVGTCVNVSDAPHGKRAACAAGPDGCPTACDGTNAATCSPASCDAGADASDAAVDTGTTDDAATDETSDAADETGGEGGSDDAGATLDGSGGDGDLGPGTGDANENANCACRTTGRPRAPYGFALFGLALGAFVLRRRRARAS